MAYSYSQKSDLIPLLSCYCPRKFTIFSSEGFLFDIKYCNMEELIEMELSVEKSKDTMVLTEDDDIKDLSLGLTTIQYDYMEIFEDD